MTIFVNLFVRSGIRKATDDDNDIKHHTTLNTICSVLVHKHKG